MIVLRPRATIHYTDGGWFSAYWHFSFDQYADPDNTWFGDLRVFNDDTLVPGAVWPMHPHRDIEGITYVAEGMFEHADSRGNGGILPPWVGPAGDARVRHGAFGGQRQRDRADALHPDVDHPVGAGPRAVDRATQLRRCRLGAGGGYRSSCQPTATAAPIRPSNPEAVTVHQDAAVFASLLDPGQTLSHRFRPDFQGYLFVVHGAAHLVTDSGTDVGELGEGGAAKVVSEPGLSVRAGDEGSELLLVETRTVQR